MARDITLGVGLELDSADFNKIKSSLQELQTMTRSAFQNMNSNNANKSMQQIDSELSNIKQTANVVEQALAKAFNPKLNSINIQTFNKTLADSGHTLKDIQQSWSALGADGNRAFENLAIGLNGTDIALKKTQTTLDRMAQTLTNTIKWNVSSAAVNGFARSVQGAYGYIKSLDTSLNNIQIVTQKSADEMATFARQANNAAKSLGTTTTAYTNASLTFYQQGLNDEEVQARTNLTTKVANASGLSADDSAEYVTSVLNAYKVGAEEAESAMDKLANVGAHTASSLSELAQGMSKAAASANAMGVSEDQLAASLATVISVTRQDPSQVGTAFKTIYARISDIKAGSDEAEVSLGRYSSKMASLGFNVLNAEGQMRDLGEVMEEIGNGWTKLSREQQIYLAQTMAGTRQYNNLIALFDNWDEYGKALNYAENSTGTLQQQQDTYMESTAAHLKQLKAAQEDVFDSILNSKDINSILDALTQITTQAAKFIDVLGGGKGLLLTLGSIGTQVFSEQIGGAFASLVTNIQTREQQIEQEVALLRTNTEFAELGKDDPILQSLAERRLDLRDQRKFLTDEQFSGLNELSNDIARTEQEIAALDKTAQNATETFAVLSEETRKTFDLPNNHSTIFGATMDTNGVVGPIGFAKHEQGTGATDAQTYEYQIAAIDDLIDKVQNADAQYKEFHQTVQALRTNEGALNDELKSHINSMTAEAQQVAGLFDINAGQMDKLAAEINNFETIQKKIESGIDSLSKEEIESLQKLIIEIKRAKQVAEDEFNGIKHAMENIQSGKRTTLSSANDGQKTRYDNETKPGETGKQAQEAAKAIAGVTQTINGLRIAVSSLSALTDDSLSEGEKALKLITGIGMALPSMINGITLVTQNLAGLETTVTQIAGVVSNPWVVGIGLAIMAVVGIIKAVNAEMDAANARVKTLTDTVNQCQKSFTEAAEKANSFKETISNYEEGIKSLEKLDKTTQNYKDSIEETNKKARELIETYGLFDSYKIEDNLIKIDENALKSTQRQYDRQAASRQAATQLSQIQLERSRQDAAAATTRNYNARAFRKTSLDTQDLKRIAELMNRDDKTRLNMQQGKFDDINTVGFEDVRELFQNYGNVIKDNIKVFNDLADTIKSSSDKIDYYVTQMVTDTVNQATQEYFDDNPDLTDTQKQIIINCEEAIVNNAKENVNTDGIPEISSDFLDNLQAFSSYNLLKGETVWDSNQFSAFLQGTFKDIPTELLATLSSAAAQGGTELVKTIDQIQGNLNRTYDANNGKVNIYDESGTLIDEKTSRDIGLMIGLAVRDTLLKNNLNQVSSLTKEQESAATKYSTSLSNDFDARTQLSLGTTVGQAVINKAAITAEDLSKAVDPSAIVDFKKQLIQNILSANKGYNGYDPVLLTLLGLDKDTLTSPLLVQDIADRVNSLVDNAVNMNAWSKNQISSANNITSLSENRTYVNQVNSTLPEQQQLTDKQSAELDSAYADKLKSLAGSYETVGEELSSYIDALNTKNEKLQESARIDLEAAGAAEDLGTQQGLEKKELEKYVTSIKQYIKQLKGKKELENADGATLASAAKSQMRFDKAVASSQKNLTKWKTALSSVNKKGSLLDVDTADELREAYANLFDVDKMDVSDAFLKDEKNLKLLETALTGTKEQADQAYNELSKMAAADYVINGLHLDPDNYNAVLDEYQENVINKLDKLAPGPINDTALINSMENMVNDLGMNANQAMEYFENLGYDVEAVDSPETETHETKHYQSVLSSVTMKRAASMMDEDGHVIPEHNAAYDVTYAQGPTVTEENTATQKPPSAVQIKTARKKVGGGFKRTNAPAATGGKSKGGGGKKGSKGKKGSTAKKTKVDTVKKDIDRYHDINITISKLANDFDKLAKAQEKLTGKALINNLNKQLDILKDQRKAYSDKIKLARQEQVELQNKLKKYGAKFNTEGDLTNYKDILKKEYDKVNAEIKKYNKLSAKEQQKESNKKKYEKEQERLEELQNLIEQYDELYTETIPELREQIRDALAQEIEINIQKFRYTIDLKVDLSQAEREWNEFSNKVLKGAKDNDLTARAERIKKDFSSYTEIFGTYRNQEYTINPIMDTAAALQKVNNEIEKMREEDGYVSELFSAIDSKTGITVSDIQAAMAQQSELFATLKEQASALIDLLNEMDQTVLEGIDAVSEAFDKENEIYDFYKNQVNHDLTIMQFQFGENAYDKFTEAYQQLEDYSRKNTDNLRQQAKYWEDAMHQAQAAGNSEEYAKYRDNWMSTIDSLNSSIEEWTENLTNNYQNLISKFIEELNQALTNNKGLDYVSEELNLITENTDSYVDAINAAFAIDDLSAKWKDAIDNAASVSTQQRLNKLMKEQLTYLEEKGELTQYDVDRAEKEYEIALKQIALEEAQRNKTTMRLKRDANGNYSYQFTADKDEVTKATQDLAKARNELYNFDKQRYQQTLNEAVSLYQDYQEKIKQIYLEYSAPGQEEERNKMLALYQEQYEEQYSRLVAENETVRTNLRRSAADSILTDNQKTLDAITESYNVDLSTYKDVESQKIQVTDETLKTVIPQFESGAQEMINILAGEGGLQAAWKETFEKLEETSKQFIEKQNELWEIEQENHKEVIDEIGFYNDATDEAIKKQNGLVDVANKVTDAMKDQQAQIEKTRKSLLQLAKTAGVITYDEETHTYKVNGELAKTLEDTEEFIEQGKAVDSQANNPNFDGEAKGAGLSVEENTDTYWSIFGNNLTPTEDHKYATYAEAQARIKELKEKALAAGKKVYTGKDTENNNYYILTTSNAHGHYSYRTDKSGSKIPTSTITKDTKKVPDKDQKKNIKYFRTGGYTGEWGDDEGRLAVLHQKELVLNQQDTKNILGAVGLLRRIVSQVGESALRNSAMLTSGIGQFAAAAVNSTNNNSHMLEQTVNITAKFEGQTDATQIERALTNLVNTASQRMLTNKK